MDIETQTIEYIMTRIAVLAERVDMEVSGIIPKEAAAVDGLANRLEHAGEGIKVLAHACALIRNLRD